MLTRLNRRTVVVLSLAGALTGCGGGMEEPVAGEEAARTGLACYPPAGPGTSLFDGPGCTGQEYATYYSSTGGFHTWTGDGCLDPGELTMTMDYYKDPDGFCGFWPKPYRVRVRPVSR